MTSNNSPATFVFNFGETRKKTYDSCFPGLTLPSSQNPLEEVGLHKQLSKTFDEWESRDYEEHSLMSKTSLNEKIISDQNVTPKSQKHNPSDVKRWASVVKAQKKLQLSTDLDASDKLVPDGVKITPEMFDCVFKTFEKNFESHKSFFVINDKMFYCIICSTDLESVLSLSNHLKTRKHEDNAIEYFKTKMPAHLHHIMEFVSFYGSNLCCNLCRCEIPMSSHNPHETIVNIMAHNSDESHLSKKVNHETCNRADTILQTLSESCQIILENLHFIERKMVPEFNCKLCKTMIAFDDNKEILTQNFILHMNSMVHMKNQKAVEVLKLFGEANMTNKDNWAVINGNITCTCCDREFETNLQQLICHVNEVEHTTNRLFKFRISSHFGEASENNTMQENLVNEAKSVALNKPKKAEVDKKQPSASVSGTQLKHGCRLRELLNTMPSGLRAVDYVIENEKGSVTCLICNRVVPPSTYNLRTHLLGSKHKLNMEQWKDIAVGESNKFMTCTSIETLSCGTTIKDQSSTSNISVRPKSFQTHCTGDVKINIPKNLGYALKLDEGSVTCMICQYLLPNSNLVNEHLASDEHKKRENLWLKNCPGCSSKNPFTYRVLKALPTNIRRHKCRQMDTIPASVLNHLYALLIKENQLIKKNESLLVKNVDGKHSYCSLCKTLIPLSLDVDILEKNLVSHLKKKQHAGSNTGTKENTWNESVSPKIARALFELPVELQHIRRDSKVYNFDGFTTLICKNRDSKVEENKPFPKKELGGDRSSDVENQMETKNRSSEDEVSDCYSKNSSDEVFIFGTENLREESKKTNDKPKNCGQNGVLPVVNINRLVKFEEETNEEVLSRRQKQVEYGKNTEGYARYCKMVPRRKRDFYHPTTPPMHLKCSRRTWDGMVRAWRRQLHNWDPPLSTLDSDIRPLD